LPSGKYLTTLKFPAADGCSYFAIFIIFLVSKLNFLGDESLNPITISRLFVGLKSNVLMSPKDCISFS
jgi:hypothetical protein